MTALSEPLTSRFIVYALTDPRTAAIRYIGMSRQGLNRPRQHAHPSSCARKTPVACWARAIRARGETYGILVLEQCADLGSVAIAEAKWIAKLRSAGVALLNLTDGGEGMQNPSQEVRDRMSRDRTGKKRPPRSAEWCANISKATKGRKMSAEQVEAMAARRRGRKASDATKATLRAAKARQREEGRLTISAEQRAKIAEAAREQWRRQAVPVMDVTTGVVYPNQVSAAQAIGVTPPMVGHVLRGRAAHARGHVFRFHR